MNRRLIVYLASSVMGMLAVAALVLNTASVARAANGQKVEVVDQLRNAHELLASADHDYDGRRAKAMEEIHKAIHEIEGKHHKAAGAPAVAVKTAKVKTAKVHVKESQAASDAKLREAMSILSGIQAEISAHHPKAMGHVNAAMGHLNIALKIK